MNENRTDDRTACNTYVAVINIVTGGVVGQLVNISSSGLMLMSNNVWPENHLFQLQLQLPGAVSGQHTISLGTESLWYQQVPGVEQFWVGFQIIDITPADRAIVQELITQWKEP